MKIRVMIAAGAAALLGVSMLPAIAVADGAVPQAIDAGCTDAPEGRFLDMSGVHAPAVDCIGWWGITQGDGEGSYSPDAPVRRDQMATFIARTVELSGGELPLDPAEPFGDVSGTHAQAIYQLAELGVVGGVSATEYNPTGTVNRAQMGSFLARAYEARSGSPLPMGDVSFPDIEGNVHADNIVRIATAGLTGGTADGSYNPGGAVTRAQMGTFLARFLALLVEEEIAAYPPANPVPLPPRGPEAVEVEVAHDPVILGSVDVEVPVGEIVHYETPLVNQYGLTQAWFSDLDATEIPGFCEPSDPYGSDRGVSAALTIEIPHDPVRDAERLSFFEVYEGDCIQAFMWPQPDAPAPSDSVFRLHVRNDGPEVFRGRAHLGQQGDFETVTHPAGTTETYRLDTMGRLDPSFETSADPHEHAHPVTSWWYRILLAEVSDVQLTTRPVGGPDGFCDGRVDHYQPDGEYSESVQPVLVEQDAESCLYEITDAPPGRMQNYLDPDDVISVTVAPAS